MSPFGRDAQQQARCRPRAKTAAAVVPPHAPLNASNAAALRELHAALASQQQAFSGVDSALDRLMAAVGTNASKATAAAVMPAVLEE